MVDQNFEGEVYYLEFEDENGNKQYFTEDVVLNHEGREYAVLVHVQDEEADHEGQDDTYMILASIEKNEEGVEVYVPLDEEDEVFETLVKLYEDGKMGVSEISDGKTTVINDALYEEDSFHPNNTGYEKMKQAILEKINATKKTWSQK